VIAIKGTCDIFSPKVVRAAAGSIFRMPLLFIDTAAETLTILKSQGKKIVGTCFDAETDYFHADLKNDIALLIGNEGGGLSRELIEGADMKVKIPMEPFVDSLNAAVAAGILMYENKR
jgi:TrmH family RNA methyltransferase